MTVRWSPEAAADFAAIVEYIRKQNPSAAERLARTIYDGVASLASFPRQGRPGRTQGTRELVFTPLPYVVVYRVKDEVVDIARILRGYCTDTARISALAVGEPRVFRAESFVSTEMPRSHSQISRRTYKRAITNSSSQIPALGSLPVLWPGEESFFASARSFSRWNDYSTHTSRK
jgi:toxin ParE1/3/4